MSDEGRRCINSSGLAIIRQFEGLRCSAYFCPRGILTIGYGHTGDVYAGQVITPQQAEELLQSDLAVFENGVNGLVAVPLTDNQFSALVCFSFNVGLQPFYRSTLLNLLNRGWYAQVPAQLARWTKANGKDLPGLVSRRKAEAALWNAA